jgi:hypothetical protein
VTDGAVAQTWAGQEQRTVHTPLRRWMTDRRLAFGVELLAVLPAVAMAFEVAASPRLQLLDYWSVLLRITNPDGRYNVGGVWDLQNEHPLIIPSFFYWADAKLFGGDNRMLGYLAVAIAAITVLLLRSALPRLLPVVLRAGLVVATSALVFSLHGIHNFALGMSGTAWLTANMLVVASLLLARKRRWLLAWLVGVLACASYGTGFAVWPALFLLACMHGERWWRRIATLVIGAAVVAVWLTMRPSVVPGKDPATDVGSVLYAFLTLIGHVWTGRSADLAAIAGGAILCGLAALLTVPSARARRLWVWWAVAFYGVLACAMIATARVDFGADIGLASRYTSLSVLVSVPLLVIVATVAFRRSPRNAPRFAVASVAIGLVGFTLGAPMVAVVREALTDVPLRAVALRAQLDDRFWFGFPPTDRLAPRLEALDHYPYTDDFTIGCGGPELGDRLALDDMRAMSAADEDEPGPSGAVDNGETRGDTTLLRGWATGGREDVRCVLFVDAEGEVTGGGQYHLPRPDVQSLLEWAPSDTGFAVIAPTDPAGRVVVVLDSGRMLWLPGKADGEAPE